MKEDVIQYLESIGPLSEDLKDYLFANLTEHFLSKKQYFLKCGDVCRNISFVCQGLLRAFYLTDKGSEISVWFMKETDVCISVKSFFEGCPSTEYIQAIENCNLVYLSYEHLQKAYELYPEFNLIGRKLTEKYYILSEERLFNIRNQKAIESYNYFLQTHHDLLLRVPAKYIASYLNLDSATFSRIKSQYKNY